MCGFLGLSSQRPLMRTGHPFWLHFSLCHARVVIAPRAFFFYHNKHLCVEIAFAFPVDRDRNVEGNSTILKTSTVTSSFWPGENDRAMSLSKGTRYNCFPTFADNIYSPLPSGGGRVSHPVRESYRFEIRLSNLNCLFVIFFVILSTNSFVFLIS